MGKHKIFNDPIYGIINYPYELLYDLIEHPYFQRLRRISQTGMAHYVYPGAHHTRFQHALGATYLMTKAVKSLKEKGVEITEQESTAVCVAILLHDIGHGPYSHALEQKIVNVHHEELSLLYMRELNKVYEGRLTTAIDIFSGTYHKQYLHELVSSQLDMDRMDYLMRDSYFTGVAEGVVGYDRLIKMLNVFDGHLVVEEKGMYSVEKFLMARRLMYWQVYLHKTAIAAEQMLIIVLQRVKTLLRSNVKIECSDALMQLFRYDLNGMNKKLIDKKLLHFFSNIDDVDVLDMIKRNANHSDPILSYMCNSMLKRQLFKVYLSPETPAVAAIEAIENKVNHALALGKQSIKGLIVQGFEKNQMYDVNKNEIRILLKNGKSVFLSEVSEFLIHQKHEGKYYVCHPPL